MLKTLKNEFRLLTVPKALIHPLVMLGAYVFGLVLLFIVLRFDSDPEPTFFPMGTIMAAMCGLIWAVIYSGLNLGIEYNMAVSMSCLRAPKLVSQVVMLLVNSVVRIIMLWLLLGLDGLIHRLRYADYPPEFDFYAIFTPATVIAYIAVSIVAALFIAGVKNRFGRKGLLVMYFVFFGSCIILPNAISNIVSGEGYLYTRVLPPLISAVSAFMTPVLWIILAAVLCAVLIFVSVRMIIKSPVVFE